MTCCCLSEQCPLSWEEHLGAPSALQTLPCSFWSPSKPGTDTDTIFWPGKIRIHSPVVKGKKWESVQRPVTVGIPYDSHRWQVLINGFVFCFFSEGTVMKGPFCCQLCEKTLFTPDRAFTDFSSFLGSWSPQATPSKRNYLWFFLKKKAIQCLSVIDIGRETEFPWAVQWDV